MWTRPLRWCFVFAVLVVVVQQLFAWSLLRAEWNTSVLTRMRLSWMPICKNSLIFLSMCWEPEAYGNSFESQYLAALKHAALEQSGVDAAALRLGWRDSTSVGPILWLHIHKELGTFTCWSALRNGERIVTPSTNCNWMAYDSMWPNPYAPERSIGDHSDSPPCDFRTKYFRKWNFTFGAIEREFHQGDFCHGFRYGVILRDPRASIMSSIAWYFQKKFNLRKFKAWLDKLFRDPVNTPVHGRQFWKLFDNYKVRVILGEDAFNLGPGQIREDHLRRAEARLSKFDFVRTVGCNGTNEVWDGSSDAFGWSALSTRVQVANKNPYGKFVALDGDTSAKLQHINMYDHRLFEHMCDRRLDLFAG